MSTLKQHLHQYQYQRQSRYSNSSSSDSDSSSEDENGQSLRCHPRPHSKFQPTRSQFNSEHCTARSGETAPDHHCINTHGTARQTTAEANPPTAPPNQIDDCDDGPLTPWAKCKAKQNIISALKKNSTDPQSTDIFLFVGDYSDTNFDNVNFKKIHELFASKYKLSNFRGNLKRILNHYKGMTGPFANDEEEEEEEDKIDKWYTSTNNHSAAYALLHLLYMDSSKVNIINNMSAEQIWQSHPLFRSYPIDDFKKYNANMKKLTKTRRRVIVEDEGIFHQDMNNVVLLKGVGKLYVKINAKEFTHAI